MIPPEVMNISTIEQSTKDPCMFMGLFFIFRLPPSLLRPNIMTGSIGSSLYDQPYRILWQWQPRWTDNRWHIFAIKISRAWTNIYYHTYEFILHCAIFLPSHASDRDTISLKPRVARQVKIYVPLCYLPVIVDKMGVYVPQDETVKVNRGFGGTHVAETSNSNILYGGKHFITYMI